MEYKFIFIIYKDMPKFNSNFSITRDKSNISVSITSGEVYAWCGLNTVINTVSFNNRFIIGTDVLSDGVNLDYTKSILPAITGGTTRTDYINTIIDLVEESKIVGVTQAGPFEISVTNAGIIDANNSTTTPLGIGATFVGTYTETTEFSEFTCLVNTDVSGTLFFDFSTNGIDADRIKSIKVTNGSVHTLAVVSQFMRVRYNNNSLAQSFIRLQTTLHTFKSKELTSTTSENINDQNDVQLVRIVNDQTVDLARNVIGDKKSFVVVGRNTDVGTSLEDIWGVGGDYNFLTGATNLEILSNNAADDFSGAGARVVQINGLDENLNEITENVLLVGATASAATTQTFFRLTRALVGLVGTNRGSNFDDLDIQVAGGGLKIGRIGGVGPSGIADYGIGRTTLGIFTVPAGKTMFIKEFAVNVGGNKTADIFLFTVPNIDDVTVPTSAKILLISVDEIGGFITIKFDAYVPIPEKTDVWVRAAVATGCNSIDTRFGIYIIDNPP